MEGAEGKDHARDEGDRLIADQIVKQQKTEIPRQNEGDDNYRVVSLYRPEKESKGEGEQAVGEIKGMKVEAGPKGVVE